jgi:hypothetical protein
MKAKEKILKGIHRCWHCRQKEMCTYEPDPYRSDLYGDYRKVWQCKPCKDNSADEL